jgi:hypothetical protein
VWYGWWAQTGPNNCWGPVNFEYTVLASEAEATPVGGGAAEALAIEVTVSITGDQAILSWPAVPGRRYRLQHKESLVETRWTDLSEAVVATEPVVRWRDKLGSQRFYRVTPAP